MIVDFGTPAHPDHWYCSAWEPDVISACKRMMCGHIVTITGPLRKWSTSTKGISVVLNIENIEKAA